MTMKNNLKRIVITGGAGFIGSNLCRKFLQEGAEKILIIDDLSTGKIKNIEENLNESLCLNIGSKKSLHYTWNYLGISLIKLNDIDKASKVFKKYFDSLIINGNEKEDFIQPLEGIIKCCQLKNDFKLYYEIKEILYENLKYISSGMISQNLNSNLFEKDQSLQDFINTIPKRKKLKSTVQNINTTDLSINVFKILFLISLSDGHVDDSEIYDLEQSVSAINHSLGLKNEFSTDKNKKVLSKLNKIKLDEIGTEFEEICKKSRPNM